MKTVTLEPERSGVKPMSVRLRQIVLADWNFEAVDKLVASLGLKTPFEDPGVSEFGLVNRVYAIGDQFLEIVVPVSENAPAARFLKRNGPGGYMLIFQVDDLNAARARADALNIRRVWNIDLTDISASHLHPADMGAAIVSIDEARPAASWRWAGPDWEKRTAPGGVVDVVIETPEPQRRAALWAEVLDAPRDGERIALADGAIIFQRGPVEKIASYHLKTKTGLRQTISFASEIQIA